MQKLGREERAYPYVVSLRCCALFHGCELSLRLQI